MYVIAGATGRVGSAVAHRLLQEGAPVRVLIRRPGPAQQWADRGADVAVVDLADKIGLTQALQGADGFFTLLPFNTATTNFRADMRALISAITAAVAEAGVPHVAQLSSAGAHLPEGTGPIAPLHHLEIALRSTTAALTAVRPVHFQKRSPTSSMRPGGRASTPSSPNLPMFRCRWSPPGMSAPPWPRRCCRLRSTVRRSLSPVPPTANGRSPGPSPGCSVGNWTW